MNLVTAKSQKEIGQWAFGNLLYHPTFRHGHAAFACEHGRLSPAFNPGDAAADHRALVIWRLVPANLGLSM